MKNSEPDYKRIYTDLIERKQPKNSQKCLKILSKKTLSYLDIITINDLISENNTKEARIQNQRHRSYNQAAIFEILNYQKNNYLNNKELALHFNLSRNTVAKWKKMFSV
ncbi:hypothetical protein SAMN05421594_2640 [Chryseobacterium oleae]|uniref:Helix-turn-helix domain-containing protein n=1 Tax=Chryseobacterium oleae TaxID=491207 RepID=A0A1I4YRZ1_CHROL|nr:transposase [Chryseobacterium oleae]SFN40781.1 hypothetical protein SAMN05421594_2640 [Chryseobacterium oleae]